MAEPTPAPAAAPAPEATPTERTQPGQPQRGPDGKFAPAAKAPAPTEAPRRYKLPGTDEELEESELLATAAEKRLESRALQARLKRLHELEALEAKRKADPLDGLSVEERRRLAVLEAKRWAEEQEEANLPPEQKALRQRQRDIEAREAKLKIEEDKRKAAEEEAQLETMRVETVETVKTAMALSGLPQTAGTAKRLLGIMRTATLDGVAFPPEVLARKLRASVDADTQADIKALGGGKVLQRWPALVEVLNGLDDEAALALLEPLGERLRKRALEGRGLAQPAQASQPPNVRSITSAPKAGQRVDPFEAQRRIEERARK